MAKQQKNIQFNKPSVNNLECQAITKVLNSGWLAAGPETEAFEKEFADYVGVKYAIFTNSGTSALKMAYKCLKELRGYNLMFYHKNTFCATFSAAEEIGIKTYPMEDNFLDINLSKKKAFATTVHYGGVLDLRKSFAVGKKKNRIPVLVEDSAHRIESNDPLIGRIRCYSFYATKNMTTGSGGMLVTNNKKIYQRCRLYWKDGISLSTDQRRKIPGTKSRIYNITALAGGYDGNDISAAIGRVQLKKLPGFTLRRNKIVSLYNESFGQKWGGNHLYPIFLKSEKDIKRFINFLDKKGIGCGYHYPGTGWLGVSLPLYPLLSKSEIDFVINSVAEYKLIKS